MRPVLRGKSPQKEDYNNYKDAKVDLVNRIGSGRSGKYHLSSFCSYCERTIETNLAVEHIEPKDGDYGKPELEGRWGNFLLACVNCNSTKGAKEVCLNDVFLPDRDNTFRAFTYLADGSVIPSTDISLSDANIAKKTLELIGLDKKLRETKDANGNLIALDRASQRMQVWGVAEGALVDYRNNQDNGAVIRSTVNLMVASGFFSVWMTVFNYYPEMQKLFIKALSGTSESRCFDPVTVEPISPHPNDDGLRHGGKI